MCGRQRVGEFVAGLNKCGLIVEKRRSNAIAEQSFLPAVIPPHAVARRGIEKIKQKLIVIAPEAAHGKVLFRWQQKTIYDTARVGTAVNVIAKIDDNVFVWILHAVSANQVLKGI